MRGEYRSLNCKSCGNSTTTELLSDIGSKIPCPKCGKECIVSEENLIDIRRVKNTLENRRMR